MSPTTGGVAPPRALTVLRLKRPRSATPFSSLHVSLPLHKRPPSLAPLFSALSLSAPHIRFRRLAAERAREALQQPGITIVDVGPDVVRRGVKRRMEAGEGGRKSARMEEGMLCNGIPMARVTVDEEDVYVREGDVIGEDEEGEGKGKQKEFDDPSSDSEMAYVRAEDLTEFVFHEEHSEEECDEEDDLDGESVDYPSTPETVSEGESEEWFEESRPFGIVPRAVQHTEYVQFESDEDAEYDGEG